MVRFVDDAPSEAVISAPEFEKARSKFNPRGQNKYAIDKSTGESGRVSGHSIFGNVNQIIVAEMKATAKKMGENPIIFEQIFDQYNNAFWQDAAKDIFEGRAFWDGDERGKRMHDKNNINNEWAEQFVSTTQGINTLLNYARWWYGSKIPGLADNWQGTKTGGGGGGGGRGGGGGGRTGPTAQEIRNQFDVDQLSQRTDDLFRAYLLDPAADPRSIAKQYVDEVVRTRGEVEIDFDTFVLTKHVKNSPRYAAIYKNKPTDISETDYISMYQQMAAQVLRPDEVADIAIGGAQFGASPEQFAQRLQRSNAYRTSAPFLEDLAGRMESIKGVLKG